jgi:heat-inducible transcriptional repressor
MAKKDKLSGRTQDILQLLIQTYITSGEPVGSKTLSGQLDRKLSPATIRNTMAELEEAGYLTHPHTSAGRVPSEKGFRFYVDSLPESDPMDRVSARKIVRMLDGIETPEELMSRASFVLSDISKSVGIVIAPSLAATQLKHIEFLDLGDGKIMVIFVSKAGLLQRKVIRVQDRYPQAELDRAGRFLIERFSDRTLTEIRNELLRMMEVERSIVDRMLTLLRTWNDTLDAEREIAPDTVFVQGTAHMLDKPEFADVGRMRELFQMFEEKSRLVKILNECIAASASEGVRVSIGSELGIPAMKGFTVISSSYVAQGKTQGFLGIIGPIRLEYGRTISAVSYLGKLVGQRINA